MKFPRKCNDMKNFVITLELVAPFPYFVEQGNVRLAGPFTTEKDARETLASLSKISHD
jgi:hypothetical protein